MARGIIRDLVMEYIGPYSDIILPIFFVCFLAGTTFTVLHSHRRTIRQIWLATFIISLIIVNIVGIPALPLVDMHKFSSPPGEEIHITDIYIVDENGTEIRYDYRAIPPSSGASRNPSSEMRHNISNKEQLEWATFLIENAERYREEIISEDKSFVSYLSPPDQFVDKKWQVEDVNQLGSFETVRIYQHTIVFQDGDADIESHDTKLVAEVNISSESIEYHGQR